MLTYDPGNGKLRSKVEVEGELDEFGKVGVIAEYWNAYVTMVAHPGRVVATPCEGNEVKCWWMVDSVMAQPRLMLIKDSWLEDFQDTIQQYGRNLVRIGEPMVRANREMCEYRVVE